MTLIGWFSGAVVTNGTDSAPLPILCDAQSKSLSSTEYNRILENNTSVMYMYYVFDVYRMFCFILKIKRIYKHLRLAVVLV